MPFNLPSGSAKRVTLGNGVLAVRPWDGVTPTTNDELGYGRGATFTFQRTITDLRQGVPRNPVLQLVTEETASLQYTGVEWSLDRLQRLMGGQLSGTETVGPEGRILQTGGSMGLTNVACRFRHEMPGGNPTSGIGGTLLIDFWRAQGSGEFSVSFGEEIQEIPWNFVAQVQTTAWGGGSLGSDQQLFRMSLYLP
jgi:hypothetical protein